MVEQFGAQKTPAIGFAIGDVTLELLLREKKLWPETKTGPEYYIASTGEDVLTDAYKIAQELRKKFVVDIDLSARKLGKQFSYADSIGAKNVIVIGEDEVKSGKFKVRNMKSGKEEIRTLSEIMK
jgi:histidyl-tRNA synthetase